MSQSANPPTEPRPILEVDHLTYAYKSRVALAGVTFSVNPRSIHGFVGPNGAGKTTTLKILATLLRPRSGSVHVFGHNVVLHYKQARRKMGFMPDHFSMYRQMTVFEYLDFFGAAYGLSTAERDKTIKDILSLTDMEGRQDDLIKGLSRGMRQRLALARVLVNDPELLLLDEPASGLDPRARIELMEILKELRRMGKTIFISSHILSELGTLCDHFTIIDRGRVKYTGPVEGLLTTGGELDTYDLTLAKESEPVSAALTAVDGVTEVAREEGGPTYRVTLDREKTSVGAVLSAAIQSGAQIVSFQPCAAKLNEAFMNLTEPGVPT
jgi:ABC-2 type transport system ATP-binding protein